MDPVTRSRQHGAQDSQSKQPLRPSPDASAGRTAGSFYPLHNTSPTDTPVLFAFAPDTPAQRDAVRQEALTRLSAAAALSDAMLTVQVQAHDGFSHLPFLEAIAILSRDAMGLLQVPPVE